MEQANLSYIKELAGDDKVFEQKFITILKEEFPQEVEVYINHIEKNEPRSAAEIVHKLKHKFNILSMEDSYKFAVNFEEELRVGQSKMHADFNAILKYIQKYLNTI